MRTFSIIEVIAKSSLSEILSAVDEESGQLVAMKRMNATFANDPEFRQMFAEEAKLRRCLIHPNLPAFYGADTDAAVPYLLMEHIEGSNLKELSQRQKLPAPVAVYIGACLSGALSFLHELQSEQGEPLRAIHREVVPENVMLSTSGQVFLVGFTMNRNDKREYNTKPGILKGQFSYMSPEQVLGVRIDHRLDIFALGVNLYEMLTGKKLFQGKTDFDTLELVRAAEVEPIGARVSGLPATLEEIVMRCLTRAPEARYQETGELYAALKTLADELIPEAQQAPTLAALLVR